MTLSTTNIALIVLLLLAVGLFARALLKGGDTLAGLWDKRHAKPGTDERADTDRDSR